MKKNFGSTPSTRFHIRHEAHTGLPITTHVWCMYNVFGREITKYADIYGAYLRFKLTLSIPIMKHTHYEAQAYIHVMEHTRSEAQLSDMNHVAVFLGHFQDDA